ncbi:hypothetical protein SS1G_08257 [Sclerotinia sclerotiorum 1980 UF-70]|uniref:Glutamine amidotransferase domain-containing protein n=2 Tax=Sclerotinia sclerotiorum (strain ATCC 18683 / 1980 / Ss-1) TaxID=665079 RepID=A7ESF2_SCLS1|nr:hypothetical protein SS1G_08257 [Sclerotinia sclerotiorum 1980 UF-70]APA12812.1 hypothetical protein sscle_10g075820 [Sclerotinia sclerotiorum 1980 UF-70]EDN92394.1 hypothetical protein SS1G_08257 [Sclerotinia sclerotiorum 1980 UF-70]
MSQPLRIAILECDTPLPNTDAKYNGYGGVFTTLLERGASTLTPPLPVSSLQISSYDVVTLQEYPSPSSIDAILISGSRFTAFDSEPWIVKLVEFVRGLLEQGRVRVVGICFGHQIVGRAMGAKVQRNEKGWELSVTPVELTGKGKEIFGLESLNIFQMHKDMVYEYPQEVEQLAYTEKCATQGMYIKGRLMTVQGHPEFTKEIVREVLEARHASGIFDDATFEDAMSRVDKVHDGVKVSQAFLKFIMED